jgi:hypothetical protein
MSCGQSYVSSILTFSVLKFQRLLPKYKDNVKKSAIAISRGKYFVTYTKGKVSSNGMVP